MILRKFEHLTLGSVCNGSSLIPALIVVLIVVNCSGLLADQADESLESHIYYPPTSESSNYTLTRGAFVIGGILALSTFDERVRTHVQDNHTRLNDKFAHGLEKTGEWALFCTLGGSLLASGFAKENTPLRAAGARVAKKLVIILLLERSMKYVIGRSRPRANRGSNYFEPFSIKDSFPSGHTTMAFALATSLSHEIDRRWATISLYTTAFGMGWSRMYHDRHWLSDVVAGAAVGYYGTKFIQYALDGADDVQITPHQDGLALSWVRPF